MQAFTRIENLMKTIKSVKFAVSIKGYIFMEMLKVLQKQGKRRII